MKTLIRKEWGSPKGNVQEFTPQEFVAACEMIKPVDNYGNNIWIDVITGNDQAVYQPGADGRCQGASAEQFYNGHAPTYVKANFKGQWIENTTMYHSLVTSVTGGASYSDTSQFSVIASPVSVYITPNGNLAYIFEGATKPDIEITTDGYQTLDKTFS